MKTCHKCLMTKSRTFNFHKDTSKRDGHYSSCKACRRILYGNKPFKAAELHVTKNGYWKKGNVWIHREIMEKYLGRKLGQDEVVHHKNGDGLDNRIENLEVVDRMEHYKYHAEERKRPVFIECNSCGKQKRTTAAYVFGGSSAVYKKNYRCMPCRKKFGWPNYKNV